MHRYDLNNSYHRSILSGTSFSKIRSETDDYRLDFDPVQTYSSNSYGYRSPEPTEKTKIVFGGCSYTYGVGVAENLVWPTVVAKKLGLDYVSLANSGVSIFWIVDKVFSYLSNYSKPDTICLLLPDPYRYMFPADGEILSAISEEGKINGEYGSFDGNKAIINSRSILFDAHRNVGLYMKKPYSMDITVSQDMSLFTSIKAIRRLEQYCNDVGIKLLWSTWSVNFSRLIAQMGLDEELKFKNYFSLSESGLNFYKKTRPLALDAIFLDESSCITCEKLHPSVDCSCYLECHEDLRAECGDIQFYNGTDTGNGSENAHPGAHLQVHFAEAFLRNLC